jgi:hypothetical protein
MTFKDAGNITIDFGTSVYKAYNGSSIDTIATTDMGLLALFDGMKWHVIKNTRQKQAVNIYLSDQDVKEDLNILLTSLDREDECQK